MSSKKQYENLEAEFYQGQLLAGVDEVGRGPLAGDVVTAAVILDPQKPIAGLDDSKKLSEAKREVLFQEVQENALCWAIGRASVAEIDKYNIFQATMMAMVRAVNGLSLAPEYVVIDGNKVPKGMPCPASAIVKGDGRIRVISAASIIAKVTRDREMLELDKKYPMYGFKEHKGYPTKQHLEALKKHGVIDQHRRSYGPVQKAMAEKPGIVEQNSLI